MVRTPIDEEVVRKSNSLISSCVEILLILSYVMSLFLVVGKAMLILLFRWGLLVLFYFLFFFKCPASVNTGVSTTTTLLAIPLENPNPPVYSWRSTATTAAISLGNNDLIVLSLSLGLGITAKCYITVGPALYASSTAVL